MKTIDISRKLTVNQVYRKIMDDLRTIHKLIGHNDCVSGKLSVTYKNVSIDIFDEALSMIDNYSRVNHFISINKNVTVSLILD